MALNNYSNLKAAIEDHSHRNDVKSRIDDFILQAEQEMYANPVEPLNARDIEQRATADTSTTSRFLELPTGFTRMRRILIDDKSATPTQYELRMYTPEVMPVSNEQGMPSAFSVTSQLEFNCVPDSTYNIEMQYYAKATALSSSSPTNDILTNYPSIYLFGSLWALFKWAKQFDLSESYYASFINSIRGANQADDLGRYGPAPFMRIESQIV